MDNHLKNYIYMKDNHPLGQKNNQPPPPQQKYSALPSKTPIFFHLEQPKDN